MSRAVTLLLPVFWARELLVRQGLLHFGNSNEDQLLKFASAGVAELVIFHPVDTIAKRLMSNKSKVCPCQAEHPASLTDLFILTNHYSLFMMRMGYLGVVLNALTHHLP